MNADTAGPTTQRAAPARHFALRLTATPRGARLARHLAAEQLDEWGLPYGAEANRTVALLVAELAANAVRHGRVRGRDFRLRVVLRPGEAVRVEVTDARVDRLPPAPGTLRPPSSDLDSGRGLLLVESLATHWGTLRDDPYTKTVWCEVALG
ncbi:MAG TPA: ATP-binding protein [Streptomyces sp.]|jgi:anti-sigma regulatory factor (Ser/Thr protein kinase)|nr:ATP-binding protein [Streptomyces sp.]